MSTDKSPLGNLPSAKKAKEGTNEDSGGGFPPPCTDEDGLPFPPAVERLTDSTDMTPEDGVASVPVATPKLYKETTVDTSCVSSPLKAKWKGLLSRDDDQFFGGNNDKSFNCTTKVVIT